VPCEALDSEKFEQRMRQSMTEFMDPQAAWFDELYYKALGFIPKSFPYAECMVESMVENIQAFYDVSTGSIVIPAWRKVDYSTLVHESVHALQDQHYCLKCLRDKTPKGSDYALAFASLVEGDAQSIQEQVVVPQNSNEKKESPDKEDKNARCRLPETLAFQYEFPYTVGRRFVDRLQKKGRSLDPLFARIPQTSSEILYAYSKRPELADFAPIIPQIDEQGPYLAHDVFGEYSIRTMLRDANGSKGAVLAALGWRGDVLVLIAKQRDSQKGEMGSVRAESSIPTSHNYEINWRTRWHSEKDANQFYEAILKHQRKNIPPQFALPNPRYMHNAIAPANIRLCQTITLQKGGNNVDLISSLSACKE
jgi:hypothetical protein